MEFTATKTLPFGFMHAGQKINQVTARPVKVRDSIDAIEELGQDASQARLRIGIEARQVQFDGVPKAEHNTDLLLDLSEDDYAAVVAAIDEAEKKRKAQNAA